MQDYWEKWEGQNRRRDVDLIAVEVRQPRVYNHVHKL
jgi:hypothetical protein